MIVIKAEIKLEKCCKNYFRYLFVKNTTVLPALKITNKSLLKFFNQITIL